MANLFGTNGVAVNPFVLDTPWTAGTIPAALTALAGAAPQRFRRIVWTAPAATTDTLVITDINGNILFNEKCSVANQDVVLWDNNTNPYTFKQSLWVLTTLGSGKLMLWK
jgi:hypothetical protein